MVTCSLDKIQALERERDFWLCAAAQLQTEVSFLQDKLAVAEELLRAMRELEQAASGALLAEDEL